MKLPDGISTRDEAIAQGYRPQPCFLCRGQGRVMEKSSAFPGALKAATCPQCGGEGGSWVQTAKPEET